MSSSDAELLRAYADEKSEPAFRALVERHVNLVYAIALRQCGGDAHLAEDVTQRVFTDLARKARQLSGHAVLGGWLYRSAQFAASDVVRAERRRRTREVEASAMEKLSLDPAADADWQKLAPVLDQVIGELPASDRDAVVLRFFEARPFADIGATLRVSEDAARMRVDRALDKLRAALSRRGIKSTAAALSVALANQAVVAAPSTLAASVSGVALAAATGSAVSGVAGTAGAKAIFMGMTKLQVGILGALVVAGASDWLIQQNKIRQLQRELAALPTETRSVADITTENVRLTQVAKKVADLRKGAADLEGIKRMAENTRLAMAEAEQNDRRNQRVEKAQRDLALPVTGPVFAANELDALPRAVSLREVWENGLQGEVAVSAVVDAEGHVREVSVLRSTQKQYEDVVVRAVKESSFVPAQKNGRPVNARIEVPVKFTSGKPASPGSSPLKGEFNWF